MLDATYEKVRHGGIVIDCSVLIAAGVRDDGKRLVLGCSVSRSEAAIHWRTFLESLIHRGLHGIELVTSDSHAGLKAALRAVLPAVKWQRCQFHLQQNASAFVPKVELRPKAARDLRAIFNAPDRAEADRLFALTVEHYRKDAPALADWIEANIPEDLTVLSCPEHHRRRLRTSNMLERLNREPKRRTRVASLLPNEASILRLVTAVLAETSYAWETGRIYLSMGTE